jgi:hypothetical protein
MKRKPFQAVHASLCSSDYSVGLLAGFAGGAAEIAWVCLYASLSGVEAAAVARGVTQTALPLALASAPVISGIAIHMMLAAMLGIGLAVGVRSFLRLRSAAAEWLAVSGALVAVWAANFLIILPAINPAFVGLLPHGATLTSKVLFGLAAAAILQVRHRAADAIES